MSDVQYAIDIATEMPSGEVTLSQLDDLTAKLVGGGKSSDVFQQAIQQSAAALDAARAAAKLTASALAEAETEYSRLERAAVQASKAAEKAAARNGGIVPDDMAAAALAASNAVNAHAIALRKA